MKEIPLGKGFVTQIDDEDYVYLSQFTWHVTVEGAYKKRYARVTINTSVPGSKRKTTTKMMHRILTGAPRGMDVDHIDGNSLNNQRNNLRVCTKGQNSCNRLPKQSSKTGIKGVCLLPSGKYRARLTIDHVVHNLGRFDTPAEAAIAYNEAAIRWHGEFARLNTIKDKDGTD